MQDNHEPILSEEEGKEASPSQQQPQQQETEMKDLQDDLALYKDKYLRALAENENARKRLQKEREEYAQFSVQNVLCDFLHPIDQMERALSFAEQASDEIKHWAQGFQMILAEFQNALAQNGVQPMQTQGSQFDPNRHEATEVVHTEDYPEGCIIEENSKGYLMGEKTLRPARVKVAKAPLFSGENNESSDS